MSQSSCLQCYGGGTIQCCYCNLGIKWGHDRQIRPDNFLYGYNQFDPNRCNNCHGSGRVPCRLCCGSGKVLYPNK